MVYRGTKELAEENLYSIRFEKPPDCGEDVLRVFRTAAAMRGFCEFESSIEGHVYCLPDSVDSSEDSDALDGEKGDDDIDTGITTKSM